MTARRNAHMLMRHAKWADRTLYAAPSFHLMQETS